MNRSLHTYFCTGLTVLLLFVFLPAAAQPTQTERPALSLEDIYASGTFHGQRFKGGRWAESGPVITYIKPSQGSNATDLVQYNLETDQSTRLINGQNLKASDVDRLIAIEDYAYSSNGKKVLIYTDSKKVWRYNTKGFYYIYNIETKELTPVSSREKGYQMFAKFSPGGNYVAFVRKRNLFLVDLSTMEETQLTVNGSAGKIINGTSDWVYEEEFGLRDGWSWSPDGQHIAFFQLDESATKSYTMVDQRQGQYPELEQFRYPKAGEKNSEIRIGVINISNGEKRFFNTGTWKAGGDSLEYIPRMGWTPQIDGRYKVWFFRLNRNQNNLDLVYGDPDSRQTEVVLEEKEPAWIQVKTGFSDMDVEKINYLDDGQHFIWISEVDGYRHLYLYRNDGTLERQITGGAWDVTDFHGIDEKAGTIYITASLKSPLERHLYRIDTDLKGASKQKPVREPVKITQKPGWHSINMSSDTGYYIDTYSNSTQPPVVTLHVSNGKKLKALEPNKRVRETVTAYDLPAPEYMTVPAADGTLLNAYLIKPKDFDPQKSYPLLLYVYGGPGSQTVQKRWGGSRYLWHAYLAREHDVLVASVDNRGTGARGKTFKSGPYKKLGRLEAKDQIAAAKHLGQKPYVDESRIGMWGWSYGGYMTLMSMLYDEGPETIKVGAAVAPVTDWRLYDTIYTERYMSTPQKNLEGYKKSAPHNYAGRLKPKQELLIVHGDMDDNVHFQNSLRMANALQKANKQFDFMVYPGRDHSIYGGVTRLHLFQMITDFITENL